MTDSATVRMRTLQAGGAAVSRGRILRLAYIQLIDPEYKKLARRKACGTSSNTRTRRNFDGEYLAQNRACTT